jgi:hypothetical protein
LIGECCFWCICGNLSQFCFSWNNLFIYLFYFFINIKTLWTILNIMKKINLECPKRVYFGSDVKKLTFTNNFGFIIVIWNSFHLMSIFPSQKNKWNKIKKKKKKNPQINIKKK